MKKIFTFLFAVSTLLVACSRTEIETNDADKGTKEFHIRAIGEDVITKTSYALTDGKYNFSWSASDNIGVQTIKISDSSFDMSKFTNTSSLGPDAEFSAAGSATHNLGNYAFYPCRYPTDYAAFLYDGKSIYYSESQTDLSYLKSGTAVANQTEAEAATKATVRLFETIVEDAANPMRHIPLIGIRKGETTDYSFKAATGVLKLTLKNLPASATQIRFDATDYALSGYFVFDTNGEIKESYKKDGYGQKYLTITTGGDSERAFYIPIPTGTIPTGKLRVSVTDGTNTLYSVTTKQDIVLVRGEITELPSITVPSVSVKIGGTAVDPTATFYFSGDVTKVKWNAGMFSNSTSGTAKADITTSGTTVNLNKSYSYQFYLSYRAYSGDTPVVDSDTEIRYWALGTDDRDKICKQHTSSLGAVDGLSVSPQMSHTGPFVSNSSPTITFAPSDNPVKGNIMITEFCGVVGKAYGNYVQLVYSIDEWKAPDAPTISMNTPAAYSPFCKVEDTPYYLFRDNMGGGPVFRVNTTKYQNSSWPENGPLKAYGKEMEFVCWNAKLGLTSSLSSWEGCPLYVEYFVIPQ